MGCARCLAVCPKDAIACRNDEAPAILNRKIAEYTKAVVDGRPCFHVGADQRYFPGGFNLSNT